MYLGLQSQHQYLGLKHLACKQGARHSLYMVGCFHTSWVIFQRYSSCPFLSTGIFIAHKHPVYFVRIVKAPLRFLSILRWAAADNRTCTAPWLHRLSRMAIQLQCIMKAAVYMNVLFALNKVRRSNRAVSHYLEWIGDDVRWEDVKM